MNAKYFKLTDELKSEFYKAFNQDNDEVIFAFFRKLLQFVENDNSPFNTYMSLQNPAKDVENIEFLKSFNRLCRQYLENKLEYKNQVDKKDVLGKAFCYLGVSYEYGLFGFSKSARKACDYYKLSSKLNCSLGTYKLAQCYETGKGARQNIDRAVYFYRCAAKLGLPDAMHTYGTILASGSLEVEKDEKLALHYLSLAALKADKSYPYPLFDIGKWYEKQKNGLDTIKDEKYSYNSYRRGAKLNEPNCQYRLARCLEYGELKRAVNQKEAFDWYKMAANNGQIDAQLKLFGCYTTGITGILKKDLSASYYWALKAGSKSYARAIFYLGELAYSGVGIDKDILLGYWWHLIAESMGSRESHIRRRFIAEEINSIDEGPIVPTTLCDILCCKCSKYKKGVRNKL